MKDNILNMIIVNQNKKLLVAILFIILASFIVPYTFNVNTSSLNAIRNGDFSGLLWSISDKYPLLRLFPLILVLIFICLLLPINKKLKAYFQFALSLSGIILFILHTIIIAPELRLANGSFILFFGLMVLLAGSLSSIGIIQGDLFISSSILGISILQIIFIIFPLYVILTRGLIIENSISIKNVFYTLSAYPSTLRILKNSIIMATTVGFLSTVIGFAFALVVERSRFKIGKIMNAFSLLPIITPPFVIGLAIIFMFGKVGWFTSGVLGLRVNFIFGYIGIVMAQTLSFAPMAFLIISGVIKSLDSTLEEASLTLGASRWLSFRTVIWPLVRPGLANAFLLSVIESLADFGNPILLGGDFDVLATSIYLAIVGRYDETLAACLGFLLLSITLTTYCIQRYWVGKKSYITVTGKPSRTRKIPLPIILDYSLAGLTIVWVLLTASLYGSVFIGSFVKLWGISYEFTLKHYKYFFTIGLESYLSTLKLALYSAPLTGGIGLIIAYLISRYQFKGKKYFEFTSMLSFAIPGTIVGIGYVMAFNTAPLVFTGGSVILVICFIFRNMPVGIRSSMAALQQIDPSLEEASLTLGAGNFRTLNKIILPLIKPAIFSGLVFSFVRAMTAISAVIFLVTAKTKLATTVILGRIEGGKLGIATAYCSILIVSMMIAIGFMYFFINRLNTKNNKLKG